MSLCALLFSLLNSEFEFSFAVSSINSSRPVVSAMDVDAAAAASGGDDSLNADLLEAQNSAENIRSSMHRFLGQQHVIATPQRSLQGQQNSLVTSLQAAAAIATGIASQRPKSMLMNQGDFARAHSERNSARSLEELILNNGSPPHLSLPPQQHNNNSSNNKTCSYQHLAD